MKEHVDGMLGQLHEVDAVPDHVQEEDTDTVRDVILPELTLAAAQGQ